VVKVGDSGLIPLFSSPRARISAAVYDHAKPMRGIRTVASNLGQMLNRICIAFDAIGGGKLAGQILTCMEAAVNRTAKEYSRYGSTTHKQVYIYSGLDSGPTEFNRSFGMAWGISGWLLFPFLQKIGPAAVHTLKQRVVAELKTTFASRYSKECRWLRRCNWT
jgi:hypothetical protein